MIVYISGPITGRADRDYLIEFMEAELKMRREGYEVINPATIGFLFPSSFEHQDYMDIDIPLLKKCEAIYMLPGWEESKGASTELRYAIKHDYTILGEVTGICAKPEPEAIHEGDVVEIISEASRFSKGLKATVLKKLTDHPDDHFNLYIRPEGGTTACWCREEDIRKITGGENEER